MATKIDTTNIKSRGNLDLLDAAGGGILWQIKNSAEPTSPSDLATKQYVDAVAGKGNALDAVVAAATGNITLSAPGASIDGVALSVGERFLAHLQTTATEKGIYVFQGAATPATRALDVSGTMTTASIVFSTVYVTKGLTLSGSTFEQQTASGSAVDGEIVIGTDALSFAKTSQINFASILANSFVNNEVPTAVAPLVLDADGVVTTAGTQVTLSATPITLSSGKTSESIEYNGYKLYNGVDYTLAGATITFTGITLNTTDTIRASFFQ